MVKIGTLPKYIRKLGKYVSKCVGSYLIINGDTFTRVSKYEIPTEIRWGEGSKLPARTQMGIAAENSETYQNMEEY